MKQAIGPVSLVARICLAAFYVATPVLYQPLYEYSDLRAKTPRKGRSDLWEFLKNFGLAGGLLTVVFGDTRKLHRPENPLSTLAFR